MQPMQMSDFQKWAGFSKFTTMSSFVLAVEDNSLRSSFFSEAFAPPTPPHFLSEIISCLSHFGGVLGRLVYAGTVLTTPSEFL